jgi:ABC-type Fe3+ transport system permease subunit
MSAIRYLILAVLSFGALLVPDAVLAAGGKAEMLIVVADDRVVQSEITKFFINQYNTDPFMFGVYCTIMTALLGVSLGLITDFLMKRTGLDLSKRTIVEH